MKNHKNHFRKLFTLSWVVLLFIGLTVPEAMATAPDHATPGALPVPPTKEDEAQNQKYTVFKEILTRAEHGVILQNDAMQLIWKNNGDLQLHFCDQQDMIWSTKTGGRGTLLIFQESDGKFMIKDAAGKIIWDAGGVINANKLVLQDYRDLSLQNSSGQTIWHSNTAVPTFKTSGSHKLHLNDEGQPFFEFRLPAANSINHKYLYLRAEGADGGKRDVKSSGFTVNGGAGATVKARFEIGTQSDQIPPRSQFRIYVGKKGATRTGAQSAGCGGGAATTIFCKKPNDPKWYLLMVAGGGGGAYSDCCTQKDKGHSAVVTEDGGDSEGEGGKNGKDGDFSWAYAGLSGGNPGHGIYGDFSWSEGKDDPTILPVESSFGFLYAESAGTGTDGGHGGAGYSGGGAGRKYHGGGGGGSFLKPNFAVHDARIIENPSTSDTQDGFVAYELTNELEKDSWTIKASNSSNLCIKVDNQKERVFEHGANVQMWTCNNKHRNQQWVYDASYIYMAFDNKKCINIDGANTSNGNNVSIKNCNGTNAQKWIYDWQTKQFRSFLNPNKCLHANLTSGANIKIWNCTSPTHQEWELSGAPTMSNPTGTKYIVPVRNTGASVALESINGPKWNSNIQLGNKNTNNTSIRWVFNDTQIQFGPSKDLCLGLENDSTNKGTNVQLMGSNSDTDTRKWIYYAYTKQIRSVADPDKCLEVDLETYQIYTVGRNLKLMPCNDHLAQQFNIVDK